MNVYRINKDGNAVNASGDLIDSAEWTGNISVFPDNLSDNNFLGLTTFTFGSPGVSRINQGTYSSPVVGDSFDGRATETDSVIYVGSDNGVIYAFDRDKEDAVTVPEPPGISGADRLAGVNDTLGNDEGRYFPVFNGLYFSNPAHISATPALAHLNGKNRLFFSGETEGRLSIDHSLTEDSGVIHSNFENRVSQGPTSSSGQNPIKNDVIGGISIDAGGRTFYDGVASDDANNGGTQSVFFMESFLSTTFDMTQSMVMPIDVDGTFYAIDDNGVLYAMRDTYLLGDMNEDGTVNNDDIQGFNAALLGFDVENGYLDYLAGAGIELSAPTLNYWYGATDINEDGYVNNDDIPAFIALLSGSGSLVQSNVPEPSTCAIALTAILATGWMRRRRTFE